MINYAQGQDSAAFSEQLLNHMLQKVYQDMAGGITPEDNGEALVESAAPTNRDPATTELSPDSPFVMAGDPVQTVRKNPTPASEQGQLMPKTPDEISQVVKKISFSYSYMDDNGEMSEAKQSELFPQSNTLSSAVPTQSSSPSTTGFNVEKVRADFPLLQQQMNGNPLIWLDNAATTQKPAAVIDAVKHFYEAENSNIHRGNYALSMAATEMYEKTRQKVAEFIHAGVPEEIIFVRGTTEGNNLVANTFGRKYLQPGDEIFISLIEHHSNILPWKMICEQTGAVLRIIPVNRQGDILLDEYAKMLSEKVKLVAVAHVSNALGTLLPIEAMIQMAHAYGAKVLIDGAQGIPHFPVNVSALDCDFYVFSAHKMFGPTGIGVVYGKKALLDALPPWQVGGGMIEKVTFQQVDYAKTPFKFEAGTGSIAQVAGLYAALDYLQRLDFEGAHAHEMALMAYALQKLPEVPRLKMIGQPMVRVGALPFVMDGVDDQRIGHYLDAQGIAVRVGHHCAQPALAFFGLQSLIRPSLAFYNTFDEVDRLVSMLKKIP